MSGINSSGFSPFVWGGRGTKPATTLLSIYPQPANWTRGFILLALRTKSSQGRRLSPGPGEKKNPIFSFGVIRKR